MAEGKLSRTTVSMERDLFEKASERWQKLGYGSFSEYVQFLLEADVTERAPHMTVRNEASGALHSKAKGNYSTIRPANPASKVAEPTEGRKKWTKKPKN